MTNNGGIIQKGLRALYTETAEDHLIVFFKYSIVFCSFFEFVQTVLTYRLILVALYVVSRIAEYASGTILLDDNAVVIHKEFN